jgi:hypothetical protein
MRQKLTLCTYVGGFAMTLFLVAAWPLWHMFPPPNADISAADWAAFFVEHHASILVGCIVEMFASSLVFIWVGALTTMLRQIEGKHTALSDAVLMIWTAGWMTLILVLIFFLAAAYRPDAEPQIVRALSDLGILMLIFPTVMGLIQFGLPGIIIICDKSAQPIFPRWLGYVCLWVALLSIPSAMIAIFQIGPFSWNGIIGFWIPIAAFGVAFSSLMWAMLRAAAKHPAFAD